jgi:hypothetical protein
LSAVVRTLRHATPLVFTVYVSVMSGWNY